MDHDFIIETFDDGRIHGVCSCGYSAIGGSEEDMLDNMTRPLKDGGTHG